MTNHIITAENLSKSFRNGEPVVKGIDLQVPYGGCFGLLGPNGAGKTTTLRMILGQSPLTGGRLEVLGRDVPGHASRIRQDIGVVPQLDNLDPDFTVAENLRVYAGFFGLKGAALQERIGQLLKFVALTEKAQVRISELSGGMKRRLSIARALVNKPRLLVLDEPTTGLDPQVRHLIWGRLRELKHAGATLLLTTHFMEEAERLCDDVVIMDHGVILSQGHPKQLIKQYVEPEVVEIHGQAQALTGILTEQDLERAEIVGETIYYFTDTPGEIIRRVEGRPGVHYLHRPANLEDVFMRLTGRELREA
ncbi:MAG: ATP-binding cassette domain-containing protein [Gammaproteobacteria bacterium]|nr:ATP-binding cassette domain-containing protein [Gammaproteobacteria bacterium]MCY4210842.1 ATP-binding cassette domain-containing protein [Gammaproteobacteria bacterium]MCY4339348.1 ATP-binding cassette domain-containing protein [Gammaproteobacteria bacterium]